MQYRSKVQSHIITDVGSIQITGCGSGVPSDKTNTIAGNQECQIYCNFRRFYKGSKGLYKDVAGQNRID